MTDFQALPPDPPPVRLEFEDVVLDLKRSVEEKGPEYVYQKIPYSGYEGYENTGTCQYFTSDNQPSCIVGHVLARHGITNGDAYWNSIGVLGLGDSDAGIIDADEETFRLLYFAQRLQDERVPWGEALDLALDNYQNTDTDPDRVINQYLRGA